MLAHMCHRSERELIDPVAVLDHQSALSQERVARVVDRQREAVSHGHHKGLESDRIEHQLEVFFVHPDIYGTTWYELSK